MAWAGNRWAAIAVGLTLFLGTVAVYWPVGRHEFIEYDDGPYITENALVQEGLTWRGVRWAFTGRHFHMWHPLTTLSHMADCQWFGLNAGAHHRVNLVLHALNALLLFVVLRRMTGALWASAAVAALFAWHPLRVESVAWAAERKDVLCGLFWLLAVWAYARYAEQPGARRYGLVLLIFILGLMTKPMIITLPFVLLLLDFWPLGRWPAALTPGSSGSEMPLEAPRLPPRCPSRSLARLLVEKVPLLTLSAALGIVTYLAQKAGGVVRDAAGLPALTRLGNALVSYAVYLRRLVWPSDLAVFYPLPPSRSWWEVGVAVAVLGAISWLVLARMKRDRFLLVGWLWYLGTLMPVAGLAVQAGGQAMADRYTYVPQIGVLMMAAWGLPTGLAGWRYCRIALVLAAAFASAVCLVATHRQLEYWQNTISLFERALKVTQGNYNAHHNLGVARAKAGQLDQALSDFTEAVRLRPAFAKGQLNLGYSLFRLERYGEALSPLTEAVRLDPANAEARTHLANTLALLGRPEEAIPHFTEAARLRPNQAEIFYLLALTCSKVGRTDEALNHYAATLRLKPDHAGAHADLGQIFFRQGKLDVAVTHLSALTRIRPEDPSAHQQLAVALLRLGRADRAVPELREALRLRPDYPSALQALAWILATHENAQLRHGEESVRCATRALELAGKPSAQLLLALAAGQAEQGRFDEAVATAQKALELARLANQVKVAAQIQQQIQAYTSGRPFRDSGLSSAKGGS